MRGRQRSATHVCPALTATPSRATRYSWRLRGEGDSNPHRLPEPTTPAGSYSVAASIPGLNGRKRTTSCAISPSAARSTCAGRFCTPSAQTWGVRSLCFVKGSQPRPGISPDTMRDLTMWTTPGAVHGSTDPNGLHGQPALPQGTVMPLTTQGSRGFCGETQDDIAVLAPGVGSPGCFAADGSSRHPWPPRFPTKGTTSPLNKVFSGEAAHHGQARRDGGPDAEQLPHVILALCFMRYNSNPSQDLPAHHAGEKSWGFSYQPTVVR